MKRFKCLKLFLVSLVLVTAYTNANAGDKPVTIRFSTQFSAQNKLTLITEQWGKEIEKKTNGRIKFIQYPGSTLTPPAQTYDSVVQGVVDAGNIVLGYTAGKFPLTEVLDYPFGYPSAYVATKLVNAYYEKFRPKELDEIKVLYLHAQAPGILHSTKPVNKLEDLKGLKFRTFGSNAEFMKLLGGTPVAMPMGDAYDAINKGVADGLMSAYEPLEAWKLAEVVKYDIENYGSAYTATFVVGINKKKWASISPEDQKIIEQISREYVEKNGKLWDELEISAKNISRNRGNKQITLTKAENDRWKKVAEPLFINYVARMKAKNLPGEEVLAFARDFLKKNSK